MSSLSYKDYQEDVKQIIAVKTTEIAFWKIAGKKIKRF